MTGINNVPLKTAAHYNAAKCFCIPVLFPRMQLTIIMFIEVPISCQLEKKHLVSLLCIHRALVMKRKPLSFETDRSPDKNRPFSQQSFFQMALPGMCSVSSSYLVCAEPLAHFVVFPLLPTRTCTQTHTHLCRASQTSPPTRCTGQHMSARCVQQMALMLTLPQPLCCLFIPSAIPFYRFILLIGIFWGTILIMGWWDWGVYGGHIDVQCILKSTQLKKRKGKKSRKCLQLSVCSNCDQICGSSEQLKPNLYTWQRSAVEFLHTNSCLSQFLNSAQTSPFIISVGGNLKSACVFLVSAAHNSRRRQHPAQSWCLFTSEFSAQSRFIAALCCIQVPWDTATLPYKDDANESSPAAKFRNVSLLWCSKCCVNGKPASELSLVSEDLSVSLKVQGAHECHISTSFLPFNIHPADLNLNFEETQVCACFFF